MADQQAVPEGQTRRHLRRLQEAHWHSFHGRQCNQRLIHKLRRADVPSDESQAITNGQWGAAITLATRRLQSMLKLKHDAAIQRWKSNTQDVAGACKWIKKNEPVPWIIRDAQDQVTGNRAHAVSELKQHWSAIFCQHRLDTSPFRALYETDLPAVRQPPRLGPINCAQLLTGARKLGRCIGRPEQQNAAVTATTSPHSCCSDDQCFRASWTVASEPSSLEDHFHSKQAEVKYSQSLRNSTTCCWSDSLQIVELP